MKTRHEQMKSRFLEAAQTPMLMRLKHDFKVHHDFAKKNKHGFNFVIIICDIMLIHTNNSICILLLRGKEDFNHIDETCVRK